MTIIFLPECLIELKRIKKYNFRLHKRIKKKIYLFENNRHHPSLRLHKLKGKYKDAWSISVTMSFRILFYYSKNDKEKVVIYMIGNHDEVYK